MAVEAVEMKLDAVMMTAPGSGWLFPGRSTKPAEDSAAFASGFGEFGGTKRPEASRKMAVTEPVAGEKAAAGGGVVKAVSWNDFITSMTLGAGNKAAAVKAKPAGTRKTKMIKVEQSYIDSLLAFRLACPPRPLFTDFTDKALRPSCEKAAALLKIKQEMDDEILKQYNAYGSAYWEVDVSHE